MERFLFASGYSICGTCGAYGFTQSSRRILVRSYLLIPWCWRGTFPLAIHIVVFCRATVNYERSIKLIVGNFVIGCQVFSSAIPSLIWFGHIKHLMFSIQFKSFCMINFTLVDTSMP